MSTLETQVGGSHYKQLAIQPVEFIHRNKIGYLEGNAIKYICRHKDKNGRQDIEKAIHYLQILLEMEYGEPVASTEKSDGPDWSQAPEWAQWWAVDEDGAAWFFENAPSRVRQIWMPVSGQFIRLEQKAVKNKWGQSLIKRIEQ